MNNFIPVMHRFITAMTFTAKFETQLSETVVNEMYDALDLLEDDPKALQELRDLVAHAERYGLKELDGVPVVLIRGVVQRYEESRHD